MTWDGDMAESRTCCSSVVGGVDILRVSCDPIVPSQGFRMFEVVILG